MAATALLNGNPWMAPTLAAIVVAGCALVIWIAGAVEEQDATTRDISRNIHDAASGSRKMSTAMTSVRDNADTANSSAQKFVAASDTIARNTRELDGTLSELLNGLHSNSA